MPNKTLTFPPKYEWPTFSSAEWATDRRHAFLKFKRLLLSMFTGLDFVVGNDNYGGDWALLSDPAARRPTRRTLLRPPHPAGVYIVSPSSSCTGFSWTFFQTTVLLSLRTTSRPASMMMMLCRMTMATLTASVQLSFRPSNATVCPLMTKAR